MNITFILILSIVLAPMLIIAILLINGKGADLIAGYNTMSKEEKATYNEKELCRATGWFLILICLSVLTIPLGDFFNAVWMTYFGIALVLVMTLVFIIYINTSKRIRSKEHSNSFNNSKANVSKTFTGKKTALITIFFTAAVLIAVGAMIYFGSKDPEIYIHNDRVQIKGMYGLTVDYSEITSITLLDQSMNEIGVGRRTSGYGGIGNALKGNFSSNTAGQTLLFVQKNSAPTIRIERDGERDIYISFKNSEATILIYDELMAKY